MTCRISAVLGFLTLLLLGCGPPSLTEEHMEWLTEEQMEWHLYQTKPETHNASHLEDDLGHPVEVVEHGYKMIRSYRKKAYKGREGVSIPTRDFVEWGWKATIRNYLNKKKYFCITYSLKDKDGFEVTHDFEREHIEAGKTITLQHTMIMEYEKLSRVVSGDCKILNGY